MTTSIQSRFSHTKTGLSKLALALAGSLALLASAPAAAAIIDFESQLPTIYLPGETFEEAGFFLTAVDNHGGSGIPGGLANGFDPTTCPLGGCPTGNNSLFYVGVNDGGLDITRNWVENTFMLRGFDFSFLAPVGDLDPGVYGQLQLSATTVGGATITTSLDFPAVGANGRPPFGAAALGSAFMNATLTSLNIRACLFDGNACVNPGDDSLLINQAQFAIDNINLAEVPEPGSMALIGLGMGALALRRRKTTANNNA
jgi:hypothetical protein